jgi:hypothetical protein
MYSVCQAMVSELNGLTSSRAWALHPPQRQPVHLIILLLCIPVMICYYLDADDHDSLAKTHARLDKFISENREVRMRC